jgi:hypothetical protein
LPELHHLINDEKMFLACHRLQGAHQNKQLSCFEIFLISAFFLPAGGVVASVLVVLSLFWVGLVDNVGIHSKGTVLNLGTLPVAIGLYGYCYSGHAVFPNIYTSMAQPSRFPTVLLAWYLKLLNLLTSS